MEGSKNGNVCNLMTREQVTEVPSLESDHEEADTRLVLHAHHLVLLLLSDRLQTPTDRAKCHKPKGTSREGNPKKEKINKNEGKKDRNTI